MVMTLYLKDATYIDWKTLAFESGHLAVDDGPPEFFVPGLEAEVHEVTPGLHQRLKHVLRYEVVAVAASERQVDAFLI